MNTQSHHPRRHVSWLLPLALAVALPAAAQEAPAPNPQIVYLPSSSSSVDNAAITAAFVQQGFNVDVFEPVDSDPVDYAKRVSRHVRGLVAAGMKPSNISVVAAGDRSPVAVLTSAMTNQRQVAYVMLGNCDTQLRSAYGWQMSGRVLGVRDAGDSDSHSCRPLWQGAPKVSERRDLVLDTGYGAALFDQPRAEWMQPVADWNRGGHVEVGDLRIGRADTPSVPVASVRRFGAGE